MRLRYGLRRTQGGQVAVLFALAAVAVVAIVGLAVDAGTSFVDQRALQAGSDTAATAGATLLAADFRACVSSSPATPYSNADIAKAVSNLADEAAAASGRATASPSVDYVWYPASTPTPTPVAAYSGQLCSTSGTWAGPTGVQVGTSNSHHTVLLQVVGVGNASEAATATADFGIVTGGGFANFVICAQGPISSPSGPVTSTTAVEVGDTVWVSNPQWYKVEPSCNQGSSDYKGFLHNPTPNPITLPTSPGGTSTITADGGCTTGQFPTLTVGETLDLPLVTSIVGNGRKTITVEALIAVKITSIDSCRVQGVITTLASNDGGLFVCPTSTVSSCADLTSSSVPAALAVQLVK